MKTKIEDSLIAGKDDNFSVILANLEGLNIIQIIFPTSRMQLCIKNITIVPQRCFGNWYYVRLHSNKAFFSGPVFTHITD